MNAPIASANPVCGAPGTPLCVFPMIEIGVTPSQPNALASKRNDSPFVPIGVTTKPAPAGPCAAPLLYLSVPPPKPAWGLMLSGNAADFYREAPWMILFPGLAISLAVFAFNLFGDALRDYLDPRFKV